MEKPTRKRSRGAEVLLSEDLDARIERVREARRVGSELPPRAAVLRAAIEAGLPQLEATNPNPATLRAA